MLTGLLMYGLTRLLPAARVEFPGRWVVVLAITAVGALVAFTGSIAFRRHKTTVNPLHPERATALVTSGIYQYSRNPMYLGMLLLLVAWGVWLANLASFVGPPLFVALINRIQIAPEEAALHSLFGESYGRYTRRVRRWL